MQSLPCRFALLLTYLLAPIAHVPAALVGYWAFDSPVTPGIDRSGNGYSLTLQTVSYIAAGKRGGAVAFNGTSSYCLANIAALPLGNSPYTLSAWIKPTATGTRGIMGWGSFGQTRRVIAIRLNGTNGLRHQWGNADLDSAPSANYSDGQWHHIAAVYDGTTRSTYMDGVLLNSDTPGPNGATNVSFRIGSTNSGEFYRGQIDEVAVWNHALTAVELESLTSGGVPAGGPKVTSFTATPTAAYEGGAVQLAWNVDLSNVTGAYSWELKSGTTLVTTGTAASASHTVSIPDLVGVRQNLTWKLRAIETGGGNIANLAGVTVAADPGRPIATPQPFLSTAGTSPLPLTLTGSDPNGSPLTFAVVTPPAKGTLTGSPPALTYTASVDATGADTFTFGAQDGKYNSEAATVTIQINPDPAPPSDISLDTTQVPAAKTAGQFVAMMAATDINPGEAHTFTLVSGSGDTDNAKFTIGGHQLRAAQSFAGLSGQTVTIRLRATDVTGRTIEESFALTVTPPQTGVVINEIHFNGVDNTVRNEFVELFNSGAAPASLTKWRLSGALDYSFPAGTTLAPGAWLLVAAAPSVVQSQFGKNALGPWIGTLSSDGETIRLRDQTDAVVDEVDYAVGFPWPVAAGGDGASLERIHPMLDGSLGGSWRSSVVPADNATKDTVSAGAVNRTYSANAPPSARQVKHSPQQPTSQQPLVFSATVTDPDGVASVALSYQIVRPGSYIPRYLSNIPAGNNIATETRALNPEFELAANWTTIPMANDGTVLDARGGDSIWTAVIAPQPHRTLIRYRITVTDNNGAAVRVPYNDDPASNFACFIYDGVPAYGSTNAATLQTLPVYHLLAKGSDWTDCMAYDSAKQINQGLEARFYYNWNGTFVYDGIVYDHIKYRTRGGNGRYLGAGKRSLRFKFHRGSYLAVRDQKGRLYPRKWQTLTTGKGIENHGSLTFGLNEWLNYRLWNAYGVPAPFAHFVHWRNITTAAEQADAFRGDFQGLIFIQEDYDIRFLEAHKMEKGNIYKLLNQTDAPLDQQRYQASFATKTGADHAWVENTLTGFTPPADIEAGVNMDKWTRYHAICQAVRHYDYWPSANKNMTYYFEPVYTPQNGHRGKLWILPFDTDASWGPNWNSGEDAVYNALFAAGGGGGDSGTNPTLWPQYFNAVREVRDIAFQPDQINSLIDESAAIIAGIVSADYARWRTAPADAGSYSAISGPGMTSLASLVQNMKNFAFTGGSWAGGSVGTGGRAAFLDTLQASQSEGTKIPATPVMTYAGTVAFPVNDLRFNTSAFIDPQGNETFGAMQWRLAEITDPTAPAHVAGEPLKLEIEAAFVSPDIISYVAEFRFPASVVRAGHTYRARVRMRDKTGRFSHWSNPVQFTATAANVAPYQASLVINEFMYHPAPVSAAETAAGWTDSDFEYIELRNVSVLPVDLTDVRFTKGVDFDFAPGTVIDPGASLVVVRNSAAFVSRYGAGRPVVGVWDAGDTLSDGGEEIKLSFGAGNEITVFTYNDRLPWPVAADGQGPSVVRRFPENLLLDPAAPANWRASYQPKGSPGGDDRPDYATWAAAVGLSGGPLDDPDKDGYASVVEYLLMSDASLPGSLPALTTTIAPMPGPSRLTLQLNRRDVPGSTRYQVQFSSDLSGWNIGATMTGAVIEPDGSIQETWLSDTPPPGRQAVFGRVLVH